MTEQQNADDITEKTVSETSIATFADLGIRNDLLQGISDLGFERPMPIQEQVIPYLLDSDRDVVGLAQTGTGKTALSACR